MYIEKKDIHTVIMLDSTTIAIITLKPVINAQLHVPCIHQRAVTHERKFVT